MQEVSLGPQETQAGFTEQMPHELILGERGSSSDELTGEKVSKVCLGQPSQEELRQENETDFINETDAQECSEPSHYTVK